MFEGTVEPIEIQRKEIEVGVDGQGNRGRRGLGPLPWGQIVEGGTAASRDGSFVASCGWTQAIEEAKPFLAYLENYSQAGPGGTSPGMCRLAHFARGSRAVPFARVELLGLTCCSILADEAGEFLFRELPPGDYESRS